MTSAKRIEELLACYGETLSDLPKPQSVDNNYDENYVVMAYKSSRRHNAGNMAMQWHEMEAADSDMQSDKVVQICLKDFVCHQSDVIEKLVKALEKSVKKIERRVHYD